MISKIFVAAILCGLVLSVASGCSVEGTNAGVGGGGGETGGSAGAGKGGSGTGGSAGGNRGDGSVDAPVGDAPQGTGNDARGPDLGCSPNAAKALGNACGCSAECESGFCADGVCCNTACNGACVSCNLPTSMGECGAVPSEADDPHGVCNKEGAETCGQTGKCNGLGACNKYAPGTMCKAASCSGGALMPASTCNGNGTCILGAAISCAPSICVNNACKLTCVSNTDCAAPNTCVAGSCGKRGLGQLCDNVTQCKSGFCADGVCCESACAGQCLYCGLPSALGRCVPVAADSPDPRVASGVTDPTRICADQGATSCGTNGLCDGSGACQRYAAGTVCKAPSCDATANKWSAAGTCRNGACTVGDPRSCAPYRCDGTRCATSCTGNGQCSNPNTCVAKSCGKKPVGSVCAKDAECGTGFCAEGVCCNQRCGGSCQSCSLPGSVGMCTSVSSGGKDPTGTCKDEGPASCGNDGTCNGAAGCRKYGPTTICVAPKCAAGTKTSASTCTGTGTCQVGTKVVCAPYICNAAGTDCFRSCVGTGAAPQCAPGQTCNGGKCGLAGNGQSCAENADCTSKHCLGGICCNTDCVGPCKSCALPTALGTCTNQPPTASDQACTIDAMNPCGNTGKCNGSGVCAMAPNTTSCRTAMCTSANGGLQSASCSGAGVCSVSATFTCGDNKCEGGVCQTCNSDADCLNGKACDLATKKCGGKSANGVSCNVDSDCQSAACVDGMCCATKCGMCQTCSMGTCAAVSDGKTDDRCTKSACGNTGLCKTGACEQVAAGTGCGTSCNGNTKVESVCTGGMCKPGNTDPCDPYKCVPPSGSTSATCAVSCDDDNGCVTGKICVGHQCKTCENGTSHGCTAGQTCADDVCKTSLGGSCTGAGAGNCALGTCVGGRCCDCPMDACNPGTCGADGTCDHAMNGTVCEGPTCNGGGTAFSQKVCNGGTCGGATTTMCMTGYKCSGGMCPMTCGGNGDCLTGFVCDGNSCVAGMIGTGGSCMSDAVCASGTCGSGHHCCASACNTRSNANKCGSMDCDNNGQCIFADTSTSCAADSCDGTGQLVISRCDGSGTCQATAMACPNTGETCTNGMCGP